MSNFGLWKSASAVVVMFDIANRLSFENVEIWLDSIRKGLSSSVPIVLVGNKIDRVEERMVDTEEAENYAASLGVRYYETSAATTIGVEHLFSTLGRILLGTLPAQMNTT
jgi:Ras-related protein Rab-13